MILSLNNMNVNIKISNKENQLFSCMYIEHVNSRFIVLAAICSVSPNGVHPHI